ncbi:MAG: phenylalanine--tRNA ligase subunit alpha [Terriglobales bacterium]
MYTVPKLDDYSPGALERAVALLVRALDEEAREVSDESSWKEFRDRWMARKNGVLTQVNDLWLKAAPGPQKREVGRRVNEVKAKVEAVVEQTRERISGAASGDKLRADRVDVTLPGTRRALGAEHPIIRTMNDIVGVFKAMGYSVAEGPEIETDYYNFESLNFPPNHPARDMQDTIFLTGQEQKPARDRLLLRTHTSPVQIRTMEKQKPPVRVVIPGRVYRNDAPDATHSPMFHQVEGLAVDTNITFCDLKGSLDHAMKSLFGSSVKTRFRPSFFPFTEPSAEVLISCIFCGGSGYQGTARCPNCKASGWIELLGSGMVDPALYGFVGYDAEKYSGFAFGMGVDRIAAMLYGVTDLQLFFNGDVRFLEQFA